MAPPAAEDSATRQSLDRYNFDRDNSPGDSKATHSEKHEAQKQEESQRQDGKRELHQGDCWDKLGFSFSTTKKWWVLIVIFAVQVSMNFNASVYGNAISGNPDKNIKGMVQDFDISEQTARVGQLVFLIAYAFGCELWAPWSEEIGRKPILQLSLFLVNIWQIPCALAPNFAIIIVCRLLGGLSSAGGSVTLGLVADMWEPDDQQYAVAFVVLSSVGGSVVGPVVGGFIQTYLSWRWVFWMQAILGGAVQLLHLVACPETTTRVLVDREAKRRRKAGEEEVYGPGELEEHRFGPRKLLTIMLRPFVMFFTEPIVLFLSLLSGFSDALIFTFLESYTPVFKQWNFSIIDTGLAFLPLLIGTFLTPR